MIRAVFSKKISEHAKANPKLLVLTGDHGYSLFDDFRTHNHSQYINAGVAEQNMVGVAAGLAKIGFKPLVYGLSAFIPMRVLEQIKIDVCYENLPVIFIGDGAGVVYSHLGTSHQCTEDVAALSAIPNLHIVSPGDPLEMESAMQYAFAARNPVYIRMGKSDLGVVHKNSLGSLKSHYFLRRESNDRVIVATGPMIKKAMDLSLELKMDVISVPLLKPFPSSELAKALESYKVCFTLEEHSIIGGLGSLLAQALASQSKAPRLFPIGIQDRFSEKCGSYEYLMKEHGLDNDSLKKQLSRELSS